MLRISLPLEREIREIVLVHELEGAAMPQYVLEFDDDDLGQPKRVEFKAENPSGALSLLQQERSFRHVKISESDELLGEVIRDGQGVWHLDDISLR